MGKDEATFISGSGAFANCRWCHGRGCLQCKAEYEKYAIERAKPIFTAKIDDPEEMAAARRVIGIEALERAFGPGGGGVQEVEFNAAVESLIQVLKKSRGNEDEGENE